MDLSEATRLFQAVQAERAGAPDDDDLAVQEAQARKAMEVAWIEHGCPPERGDG